MSASFSAKLLLLTIATFSAAGCTNTSPLKLRAPATTNHLALAQPFVYELASLGGSVSRHTLIAGTYQATGEDKDGTYFLGGRGCLQAIVLKAGWDLKESAVGKPTQSSCGIYVPSNPNDPPKVFVVVGNPDASTSRTAQRATSADRVADDIAQRTSLRDPVTGAAAAGLASGFIQAMIDAERGNYHVLPTKHQPDGNRLRAALALEPIATTPR